MALENELKTMRDTFEEEINTLREELRHVKAGMSKVYASSPTSITTDSSLSLGMVVDSSSQPPGCGANVAADGDGRPASNDRIRAALAEAASIVFDLAGELTTEDTFWKVYHFSTKDFDKASSHGLTREEARRKMRICKNDAEKWTRIAREQLGTARDRAKDLYLDVGRLAPPTAHDDDDDPIVALRDLYALLNRAVEKVDAEFTMTIEPTSSRLLEKERDAFYGNLNESEDRLKKALRAMGS